MKSLSISATKLAGLALLAVLASTPALAQQHGHGDQGRPDAGDNRHEQSQGNGLEHGNKGPDHGNDNRPAQADNRPAQADNGRSWGTNNHREAPRNDFRFADNHRSAVNDYYGPRFSSGRCPPGLAKRGHGCMPPGQARRWEMGHQLPRGVVSYPLPRDLSYRLPAPPHGQRYVRVGADILLITIGTSLVIDAIQDIGGY